MTIERQYVPTKVTGLARPDTTGLARAQLVATEGVGPAASPARVLALQRRAGNRAVRAWLNDKPRRRIQRVEQTVKVGEDQSVRYDDALVAAEEVQRLWTRLRTGLKARVDPAAAAEIYRAARRDAAEKAQGFKRPPVAVGTLNAAEAVMEWKYVELAGLEQALEVARSIPALARRGADALVFGKVSALLDFKIRPVGGAGGKKEYEQYAVAAGPSEHAETVVPTRGAMSIVLAANCPDMNTPFTATGASMDPVVETGNRASDLHKYDIKARRMAWVHELGHTLYPAYKAEWEKLVTAEVKKREGSPTGYAAEKPPGEEDFCESFMVLALYPQFKHLLGNTRMSFFARHPDLLVRDGQTAPSSVTGVGVPAKV